jgi:hypothetical protein
MGKGFAPLGVSRAGMSGISIGLGWPAISVRMPTMLWKYAVVRRPPFHQVEYTEPVRRV